MVGEVLAGFTLNSGVMFECALCGIPTVLAIARGDRHGKALRWEGICPHCGHTYRKELWFELVDKDA